MGNGTLRMWIIKPLMEMGGVRLYSGYLTAISIFYTLILCKLN